METEARLFKALSDPTRIRIAALLATNGETCVCYLAAAVQERDFKVSKHLGVLRSAGVVEARREGTWMHYKLAAPRSRLERTVFQALRRHAKEDRTLSADRTRLSSAVCCPR